MKTCIRNFFFAFCFLFFVSTTESFAAQFSVQGRAVLRSPNPNERKGAKASNFTPYIEAKLRVYSAMPVGKCEVKVYFMDGAGNIIYGPERPSSKNALPYYFFPHKPVTVRISAPGYLLERTPGWTAIVVFGDDEEVAVTAVKANAAEGERTSPFWFPAVRELDRVAKPGTPPRGKPLDKVHEMKCLTGLPDYPHFTLFTRLPTGVKSGKETKGVLCLALLANQVQDVRLSLVNREAQGSIADLLRYADKQKLVILCWAIKPVWDGGMHWDEVPSSPNKQEKESRARMKKLSEGWASGVYASAKLHDFEPSNFALWGYSNSAQFAVRLAMLQPRFFSAVHLHNPSGFDKPLKAAEHIVWGLTMGESDAGYGRAVKFQKACYMLDYSLIFKGVPNMGHDNDLGSRQLATLVFEYARSLPTRPKERLAKMADDRKNAKWVGDWLNQILETGPAIASIPSRLRVPLPTESLAKSWLRGEPLRSAEDPAGEISPEVFAEAAAAMRAGGSEKDYDANGAVGGIAALPPVPAPPTPLPVQPASQAAGAIPSTQNEETLFGKRVKEPEQKP